MCVYFGLGEVLVVMTVERCGVFGIWGAKAVLVWVLVLFYFIVPWAVRVS